MKQNFPQVRGIEPGMSVVWVRGQVNRLAAPRRKVHERKMRIARKLADGPGTCRRLSAAHRPPIAEINRLGVSVSHTSQFATSQTLYTVCRLGRCANWAHRPLERGHSCARAPPPRSTGAVASLRVPLRATRQRCRGPRGAQAGGARRRRALRLAILFRPDGLRRCLA